MPLVTALHRCRGNRLRVAALLGICVYTIPHAHAQSTEYCEDIDSSLPRTEKRCWYGDRRSPRGPLSARQPYQHGKPHGTGEAWYEDGSPKFRITYDQGKRQGPFERWDEDGTLIEKRFHVHDVPHGEWGAWTAAGNPLWLLHFDMGRPTGEWALWSYDANDTVVRHMRCQYGGQGQERAVSCEIHKYGRLSAIETYEDQRTWEGPEAPDSDYPVGAVRSLREHLVRNGPWIEYGPQGQPAQADHVEQPAEAEQAIYPIKESAYANGELHGPFRAWYGPDRPRARGAYITGIEHGAWQEWHHNGTLIAHIEWDNKQKHGRFEHWYEDGTPAERGIYQRDKKHGLWEQWRADGSLASRGHYQHGQPEGPWEEREENGHVHRGIYREGKRHGQWTTRDASGAKRMAGLYVQGKKRGPWLEWSASGQKTAESHYGEDGRLHGAYTEWHQDGSIALRGQYENGKKQGLWQRFAPAHPNPGAAPGAAPGLTAPAARAAEPAEPQIAPGMYFDDELFQPIDYQVHGGCGAVFPAQDSAGLLCGLSVVRSHRWIPSAAFLGYGVDLAGEVVGDEVRTLLGPTLRAGLATRSRKRGTSLGKGTFVYAQATPYLVYTQVTPAAAGESNTLGLGMRLGVGYTSPRLIEHAWTFEGRRSYDDDDYDEVLLVPVRILLSLVSHGELVYGYEPDRGSSLGFMLGLGF